MAGLSLAFVMGFGLIFLTKQLVDIMMM